MLANLIVLYGLTSNRKCASRSDKKAHSNVIETAFNYFPKTNLLQINNQMAVRTISSFKTESNSTGLLLALLFQCTIK